MEVCKWQTSFLYKEPFINIGNWNLNSQHKFSRSKYVSADTETKLYLDGKLLTEDKAHQLYVDNGAQWVREHVEVKAYAFMLSDGDNFALFQNIEDFILCCAMLHVDKVFWYNARFDFAIFDYYFALNGWTDTTNREKKRGKIGDKHYSSLNGDYGQRYQLMLWKSYRNNRGNIKVHKFKMLDICNIFPGGLKKNLIDWGIQDKEGNEVRKLTMDYVNGTIETDLDYMIADTKGLHLLAIEIEKAVKELSGYSLFNGDYMTAGGLAKKSLLKFMYGKDDKDNLLSFQADFPMNAVKDRELRINKLYQGGKCFVNPYKVGKIQYNIYKYDVNSMYPNQMRNMKYPYGNGKRVKKINDLENKCYILCIKNTVGKLKDNMLPVWYDTIDGEYKERIIEPEERIIWLEELEELKRWYFLSYDVVYIEEYNAKYCEGAQAYVDNYYKVKCESKGSIKRGAKLFLNSAYGKLAQRIERQNCHYELSCDGYIHLVKDDIKIDDKAIMSVLVGSRVTALARVSLMVFIREICKGDPKKNFIYCDTDSVHALTSFEDTDDKALGKMKCEGVFEWGKYLAPKTYLMYNNIVEDSKEYEVHTKGVNTSIVKKSIEQCETLAEIDNIFKAGVTFRCLTSLNVKGGKALIYIDKMLLNPKLDKTLKDDEIMEGLVEL